MDAAAWSRRARRRIAVTRCGQCALLGACAAAAVGALAWAEGAAPLAAAAVAFVAAGAWALVARPPWAPADAVVDPAADPDGLLRTALGDRVPEGARARLAEEARRRGLRPRGLPFPELRPVALVLLAAAAVAAWSAAEPVYRAGAGAAGDDSGRGTAGRDASPSSSGGVLEEAAPRGGDGATAGAEGQWTPVAAGSELERAALRGGDVPLRARGAVERFRQQRSDDSR